MPQWTGWRSSVAAVDWRFVAAWLATLTLIWTTYALAHSAIVKSMARDLDQRLETDTLVLEDHASRALDGVVSRLEAVATLNVSDELADTRKFSKQLRDLLFDDTVVRSLSLIDQQGNVLVSSNFSNIGKKIATPIWESIGPSPTQPRRGVQFGSAVAQRDLTDQPVADYLAQAVWLGQIDVKTPDLAGHRWVVTINAGFFQNFWSAATNKNGFQVALYSYSGQRLVGLGEGPEASTLVTKGLKESLAVREKGEVLVDELNDWLIRYRASARHPLVFVMFVGRASIVQQQLDRTAVLRWSAAGTSLLATLIVGLFYLSSRRYHRYAWTNNQLRQQAHTDALTGLANRRAFDELLPQELTRAGALGLPMSLMIMDLDHFKSINDQFGHAAGDAVLTELAKRWQALLRSHDLIARIGGEEFCVVLPGTTINQAETVALKLLEETQREGVAIPGVAQLLPVTVSIGLLGFDACPVDPELGTLLRTADSALYRAKDSGRNRVVTVSLHGKLLDNMRFTQLGESQATDLPSSDAD